MKIWALKDYKIGSSKQTEFLANSLSDDVIIKNIKYTKYIVIPNIIKPFKVGIDFKNSDELLKDTNYPDIIIFSGRRLAGLAIYLKKYIFKKTKKIVKIISILNPNYSFKYFDIVILPNHDNIKKDKYNNILSFYGSLCINNIEDKKQEIDFWEKSLINNKKPFYSFMIGGDTKDKKIDINEFKKILNVIVNFVKEKNGTLLISSSRRTSEDCLKLLNDKNITCDYYLYKWGKTDILNPYYAFIKLSDIVFLTADSISMISEIATIGKPIYAYMPENLLSEKHIKFCSFLLDKKIIKKICIDTNIKDIEPFTFEKLNELDYVSKEILKRI